MCHYQRFDLGRADVLAAPYDDVLDPAGYPYDSAMVYPRNVAGPEEPVAGERPLVLLGRLEIAGEHARPAGQQLPFSVRRKLQAILVNYLETVVTEPRFIETHRLSPYPARSTDIGVVLDLMIHDLDVVLAFVKSPVTNVDAVGIPVLSKSEDIANARLRFANGCVANLTVSRVSPDRMRKIRVFSGGDAPSYISLDYRAQEGFIYRIARDGEEESSLLKKLLASKDSTIVSEFAGKRIVREPVPIAKDEPLKLELQHFVECVREKQTPLVSGESAKRALDLAFEITRQVQQSK